MPELPPPPEDPSSPENFFKAELAAMPIVDAVVKRMALVAGNLEVVSENIAQDFTVRISNHHQLESHIAGLEHNVRTSREEADMVRQLQYTSPLYYAATSVRRMRIILNSYAAYAPSIFRGYTPVSIDRDWSAKLQDDSVKNFSRREERLIMMARFMEYEGVYEIGTFNELQAEGIRSGVITE